MLAQVRPRLHDPALWLLDRLVGGSADDHGELLGFLLFDPDFADAAARLGADHAELADRPMA